MPLRSVKPLSIALATVTLASCASHRTYHNANMDFASVHTVAVLPFWNLSKDPQGADRVRDVFTTALLATNAVYVVPTGEVARAVSRVGLASPVSPAADEVVKLCGMLKADAVITGVLKEYGEVRSASSAANVVALSLQMQEAGTGKVVWSGSSTKGGVGWSARLLGTTGGDAVNDVTEQAVDDLLRQLFR
jgi:polysaccharide biosynthesis protein PelC